MKYMNRMEGWMVSVCAAGFCPHPPIADSKCPSAADNTVLSAT